MKCGCVAQGKLTAVKGVRLETPRPMCLTHDCDEVADSRPDLAGRQARCGCKKTVPSSFSLAFFEYMGPGSPKSTQHCKCGYYESAHRPNSNCRCRKFVPHGPYEFDSFYCGHAGWD